MTARTCSSASAISSPARIAESGVKLSSIIRAVLSDCATVSCSSAASWPRAPSSAATRPDSSSKTPALAFSAVRR
jgi:hypothetical protein